METLKYPEHTRFEKRIHRWYALVNEFPKQLYDLSENEYIRNKVQENADQVRLQKNLRLFLNNKN
jgi:hypothetical protein